METGAREMGCRAGCGSACCSLCGGLDADGGTTEGDACGRVLRVRLCTPQRDSCSSLRAIDLGNAMHTGVSVAELGRSVRPIFDRYHEFVGRDIPIVAEDTTLKEPVAILAEA